MTTDEDELAGCAMFLIAAALGAVGWVVAIVALIGWLR